MKVITENDIHPKLRVPWESKEDKFIPDFNKRIDPNLLAQYEKELFDYESANPTSALIKDVPHIKLDLPSFDYTQAWNEIQTIDENKFAYCNLRNYKETQEKGPLTHAHWCGLSSVNYTPHSWTGQGKQAKEEATLAYPQYQERAAKLIDSKQLESEDMNFYRTEIYDQIPTVSNFIKEHIADKTYRVNVWKIKEGGYLNWHNHARLPWHRGLTLNDKAIIHIPIYTHPDVKMLVRKDEKIYAERYNPGEAWVFNYIYDHAVDNPTDIFRCHIVLYVPLTDKKFCELVERSLNAQTNR